MTAVLYCDRWNQRLKRLFLQEQVGCCVNLFHKLLGYFLKQTACKSLKIGTDFFGGAAAGKPIKNQNWPG